MFTFAGIFVSLALFLTWGWLARVVWTELKPPQTLIEVSYGMLRVGLQLEASIDPERIPSNNWYHPTLAIITSAAVFSVLLFPFVLTLVVWFRPARKH